MAEKPGASATHRPRRDLFDSYRIIYGLTAEQVKWVWLSERDYAIGDVGPAGGLIFYENPKLPEICRRRLAVFGSYSVRSKRGREMELFSKTLTRGSWHSCRDW